ncbi:MAG: serine hydrolase [Gemmatimonadota bacterium]
MPAIRIEGEAPVAWVLEDRMAYYKVPGISVAVLQDGELLWARGWGSRDVEAGEPVTTETLFQAASMSKPVAALVALSLVEEGRLELDAPVNRFLTRWRLPENEFTADSSVTLRHLLTHSGGTTVWGFPGYRKDRPFGPDQPIASNAQVLDGLGNTEAVRVYTVPGTGMRYSGGGYTILEQVVEDATGLPFDEAARERVLGPAGLERSTYAQPLPQARWDEASRGYLADGTEVEGEWHTYPEQAAAGLWTTPTELATLSTQLLEIAGGDTTRFLSPATVEAALTPNHPGEAAFQNWGLGFGLTGAGDTVRFGHGGANKGFRSQWVVYRASGDGAVIMTNGDRGSPLIEEVLRALAATYGWPDFQQEVRRTTAVDPEALAVYAGDYEIPEMTQPDGTSLVVEIRPGDGVLEVEVPGRGPSTLHPDAGESDLFFDVNDGTLIRFERDAAGTVTAAQQVDGYRLVRR